MISESKGGSSLELNKDQETRRLIEYILMKSFDFESIDPSLIETLIQHLPDLVRDCDVTKFSEMGDSLGSLTVSQAAVILRRIRADQRLSELAQKITLEKDGKSREILEGVKAVLLTMGSSSEISRWVSVLQDGRSLGQRLLPHESVAPIMYVQNVLSVLSREQLKQLLLKIKGDRPARVREIDSVLNLFDVQARSS